MAYLAEERTCEAEISCRGVPMEFLATRRQFILTLASAMADFHIITNNGKRILVRPRRSLSDRIYASVANNVHPQYLKPQPLGKFVGPSVLGEASERYRGHCVIGSCQWLGASRSEVLKKQCEDLSLELDPLNKASILDMMEQVWLHDKLDKTQPAIAYSTNIFVSSRHHIKDTLELSQEIDFPRSGLNELETSASLKVQLDFSPTPGFGQPPVVICPKEWSFVQPENQSSLLDYHHFTNTRQLFRKDWGSPLKGAAGSTPAMMWPIRRARTHVTTFVPAGVEDGAMMEQVCRKERPYSYHEVFQPVRYGVCLRMRIIHLARFLQYGSKGPWINQVNISFEPSSSFVMDINTRSQHFEYWAPHHVGLKELLETHTTMWL